MKIKNTQAKVQIDPSKANITGMLLIVSTRVSKENKFKKNVHQEDYTFEQIMEYKNKHDLFMSTSNKDVAKHMINNYNSTLKKGEFKRLLNAVFTKYSGTYYLRS